MPTVDVSSFLTGRNPIRVRQSTSYTMPVLSPRHSSSATLTGSYRSTFSSSSVSRPYYGSSNTYSSPRINSYSERFTSKTYTTDDGKKLYSRHASITEDGITTRYREDSREKSSRRDSLSRDRDLSVSRSDSSRDSRNNISTLTMIESVADLRNKYSPANYVPAVLRKQENISRSKSINDIGRPPIETKTKTKKVTDNNVSNGVALINNTNNKLDNTVGASSDSNGNRTSVAEIRKKFDPNYRSLVIEGIGLNQKQKNTDDSNPTLETKRTQTKKEIEVTSESLVGGNKFFSRPAKCFKINDLGVQETDNAEEASKSETSVQSVANITWNNDATSMDVSDTSRPHNHTTNFASYIPTKDFSAEENGKEEEVPMNQNEDLDMENSDSNVPQYTFQQNRILTSNNDISTSPRLNRIQTSSNSISVSPGSRASPPGALRDREDSAGPPTRQLGLNGLKNIGNTCFMNSVIQCLSNTRYLLEYVKGDEYMNEINTSISSMKGALIKAFSQVISELWSSDSQDRVVNTVALKSQIQRFAPRFMGYAQQDAQEFLRYLLEGLHEDVNRVKAKPPPILTEIDEKLTDTQKASESWHRYLRIDNSHVVDTFVGQLKSTLRCTHCGHASVTFDPFWDLSLPIPQRQGPLRLAQCLEHFTREETLDGDEKPTCSKCKERRKCTKSFSIQKFPRVLVIHLKRFSPTERFRGKLNVVIDFPLQGLDLSPFAAVSATDCLYNLYAISNHSGTTYSGHYTAYCKHPYQGQWHEYNDSRGHHGPAIISCSFCIILEQLVFLPASPEPLSSCTTSPESTSSLQTSKNFTTTSMGHHGPTNILEQLLFLPASPEPLSSWTTSPESTSSLQTSRKLTTSTANPTQTSESAARNISSPLQQ